MSEGPRPQAIGHSASLLPPGGGWGEIPYGLRPIAYGLFAVR